MYFGLVGTNIRLLGSAHRFPADKPNLPGWISAAYTWSDCVFTETDDSNMLAQAKLGQSRDLKHLLPTELWDGLDAVWPDSGPLAPLNALKPWAALLFLPMLCTKTASGVEEAIRQRAKEDGKPVRFLERGEAFTERADRVPLSELEGALRLQLSDLSLPGKMLDAIHSAWISNDLEALYEVVRQSPTFAFPALKSALLTERNQSWSKTLLAISGTSEKTLVIVGALHLCGPDNLFDFLGHAVQELPTDA